MASSTATATETVIPTMGLYFLKSRSYSDDWYSVKAKEKRGKNASLKDRGGGCPNSPQSIAPAHFRPYFRSCKICLSECCLYGGRGRLSNIHSILPRKAACGQDCRLYLRRRRRRWGTRQKGRRQDPPVKNAGKIWWEKCFRGC